MDFLLQCARYISSFHSPQTVVVFSFRNLPEFTFLVSRTQFSQGWWGLQVFLQFSKLKEISQTDFYLTHTLLLNSCSCRGQLMRPWIKLNVMFYFFDSLYHTENFIPILMRTNLWETKSHPVNLPDMEKRDGTPFMGLTTQDGIPSVDAKTTNKRCEKFHFLPYFTSLHLHISPTFAGAPVAWTRRSSARAKPSLFKSAKTAFTSPPLRSGIGSTEERRDISTATGIEHIG